MQLVLRLLHAALALLLVLPATPAFAVDPTSRIEAVSFSSATNGVMVGGYATGGGNDGFISTTSDGGATWNAIGVDSRVIGAAADGAGGFAVPDYQRQLWGDVGGSGWELTPSLPGDVIRVQEVAVTSGGRLVAVGKENFSGQTAFIKTSDDNGATWTDRYRGPVYPPPSESQPAPSSDAEMEAVDRVPSDHSVVWAFGNEWQPSTGTKGQYKQALVYRSADNGTTWHTNQTPPASLGFPITDGAVATPNLAFAVGLERQLYSINWTGTGLSWTAKRIQRDGGDTQTNIHVYSVDALDANTLIIGADRGRIGRSTDGGTTFTYFRVPGYPIIRDVQMITAANWIAVGDNETIYRTFDGGKSWSGTTGLKAPSVAISGTVTSTGVDGTQVKIAGSSSDGSGSGVTSVQLSVSRNGGSEFFNGTGWQGTQVWLGTDTSDGYRAWSYAWPGSWHSSYRVTARATDGMGLSTTSSWPVTTVTRQGSTTNRAVASVAIARDAFDTDPVASGTQWGTTDVVIASHEDRAAADPLAAAGLCGVYRAPLLLVSSTSVDSSVEQAVKEIAQASPDTTITVHIVGGTTSVPDARFAEIENAVGDSGKVAKGRVVSGGDRYTLAAAIAMKMKSVAGTPTTVFVANGADPNKFFDALALSPVAAQSGSPILLVSATSVPKATTNAINNLKPSRVVVVGGSMTVSDSVVKGLKATRWWGSNRYTNALAIADKAVAEMGATRGTVGVASAMPFALMGGAAVGMHRGVLVLTDGKSLTTATGNWLTAHKTEVAGCKVYGDTGSMSSTVFNSVKTKLAP